jgi:hypothetical protein
MPDDAVRGAETLTADVGMGLEAPCDLWFDFVAEIAAVSGDRRGSRCASGSKSVWARICHNIMSAQVELKCRRLATLPLIFIFNSNLWLLI